MRRLDSRNHARGRPPPSLTAVPSALAEKIRTAISDLGIVHALSRYGRVTASIGTAAWTPDANADVSTVIRTADQALDDAKAAKRNVVAQSEPRLVKMSA